MESNITRLQNGTYKAFVMNYKAATNINKLFNQYKDEKGKPYKFEDGEEAIFTFLDKDYAFVKATLIAFGVYEV